MLSLAGNLRKVAGLFVVGGDINAADNLTGRAPIPLALAATLLIGLLVALRRAGCPTYALLAIWFLWMLLPTILTEDAPSIRRAIGATPALAILIAVGIGWVCDLVLGWAGKRGKLSRPRARARPGLKMVCGMARLEDHRPGPKIDLPVGRGGGAAPDDSGRDRGGRVPGAARG